MAALAMSGVRASDIDLQWLWDNRYVACHGNVGEFTRKFLTVASGELQGAHHIHVSVGFVRNHYLSRNEVDAVYEMMLALANNPARFKGSVFGFSRSLQERLKAVLGELLFMRQLVFEKGHCSVVSMNSC